MPSTLPYPSETAWSYKFKGTKYREGGHEAVKRLVLEYEMPYSRITDHYAPEERDARDLLDEWLATVDSLNDEDLSRLGLGAGWLYLRWGVSSPDGNVAEHAPFQIIDPPPEDFLTHFSWPTAVQSGEPINWLRVPVEDSSWRPGQADNGGFVQEATGWKPAPLQPLVHVSQFRGLRP